MIFLPEKTRPLIIAHRGASAYAPENTLAAFKLAFEQGADGIELDVQLSADGEVVVCHDGTVNRTTNGQGRIADLTLEQLQRLDAGSWFDAKFKGERIPTLAEVFEALPTGLIDVELKPGGLKSRLPELVTALVHRFGFADRVLVTSFHPLYLKNCSPLPTGFLELPGLAGRLMDWLFLSWINPRVVLPHFSGISIGFMEAQRKVDRKVFTWVVNDPFTLRTQRALGVEAVITDNPLIARQALEAE